MKKRGRKSKILVFVMSLIMIFTSTNTSLFAFAAETDTDSLAVQSEETAVDEVNASKATKAVDMGADSDEETSQILTAKAEDGAVITVKAPVGVLPEGANVKVEKVKASEVRDAVEAIEKNIDELAAYDITIINAEGREIQPEGAVNVTIKNAAVDGDSATVYHVNDNKTKAEKVKENTSADKAEFKTDHFSIYVVATNKKYESSSNPLQIKVGDKVEVKCDRYHTHSWSSNNTSVATVSSDRQNGRIGASQTITAVKEGIARISCNGYDIYVKVVDHVNLGDVHHIDIASSLTATVIINGKQYENVEFNITPEDKDNISVSAKYDDGTDVDYNWVETTTDDDKGKRDQVRLEGDSSVASSDSQWGTGKGFPIGTMADPVRYTVQLKKTLTIYIIDGTATTSRPTSGSYETYEVPVTLNATASYWQDNTCPELTSRTGKNITQTYKKEPYGDGKGFSGIDMTLENGSGSQTTTGTITIQKNVEGLALTEAKTFIFNIYKYENGQKGDLYKSVDVTVEEGGTVAQALVANIPFGTYYVEEDSESAKIEGYVVTTAYESVNGDSDPQVEDLSSTDKQGIVSTTNTYEKEHSNTIPDDPYITVSKTFSNIPKEAIPENFKITVGDEELGLSDATSVSEDGLTYTWKLENLEAGEYRIGESGTDVTGYILDADKVSGIGTVTTKA